MRKIQHLRELRGYSRNRLAGLAEMCGSTLGQIELGNLRGRPNQAVKLTNALGLPPDKASTLFEEWDDSNDL
ncbi:MAG: helix-turn-helix transcriptional regulator [Actinomycetota bacterium]|nr:helix-turn-helix transcriptional regulator [Actinomycetota bacterium]